MPQELQDTVAKYKATLKEAAQEKKRSDKRIAELEAEVDRLSARCRDLVEQGELTSEVSRWLPYTAEYIASIFLAVLL